jgi:hypothetical protein
MKGREMDILILRNKDKRHKKRLQVDLCHPHITCGKLKLIFQEREVKSATQAVA